MNNVYFKAIGASIAVLSLISCGSQVADCNNEEVKDTALNLLNKQLPNLLKTELTTKGKFVAVSTISHDEHSYKCSGMIEYSYPKEYGSSEKTALSINYDVKGNEMEKDSFVVSISTFGIDSKQIEALQAMELGAYKLLNKYGDGILGRKINQLDPYESVKNDILAAGFVETNHESNKHEFKKDNLTLTVITATWTAEDVAHGSMASGEDEFGRHISIPVKQGEYIWGGKSYKLGK